MSRFLFVFGGRCSRPDVEQVKSESLADSGGRLGRESGICRARQERKMALRKNCPGWPQQFPDARKRFI